MSAGGMIAMMQTRGLLTGRSLFALIAIVCLWGVQAMAADGLITVRSSYGPKDTMNRLEAEVKAKGMTVFARIDHAAGAAEVGLPLRPTEVLIFGAAKGGTPLMQAVQTIGISAAESVGLAGRVRCHMALIQRSRLAREAARSRLRGRGGGEWHDGRACGRHEGGNRISIAPKGDDK